MKRSIILLLLAVFANVAFAQEGLSLMTAIEKALENNYDIRVQKMDEQISSLNNNWGTAGRYPTVAVSMNSNNKADFNENDNYNQYQLIGGVSLSWVLFDGFKVNIAKHRLEELEKLTKGYSAVLVEGTIQSVMMAYYKVLLQTEILTVYKANEQLSKDRLDYQQIRKDLGNAVSYEVLQAQNAYLADQSNVLLQEASVKAAKRDLAYLMGQGSANFTLTDNFEVNFSDYALNDLSSVMLDQNKSLMNQYINQSLLEKSLAAAKANYYPRLSLSAGGQMVNHNQDYATLNDINSTSSNVYGNLTLSYNLFNGGVRSRAVQIAKIEEEIGQVQTDDLKLSLSNQLASLLDYYEARKSLLNLAVERLKVAEINLQISDEKLKAGAINSFNYRDVQLNYQNAAISKLNAVYNLIDTDISILRLTGQIIDQKTN